MSLERCGVTKLEPHMAPLTFLQVFKRLKRLDCAALSEPSLSATPQQETTHSTLCLMDPADHLPPTPPDFAPPPDAGVGSPHRVTLGTRSFDSVDDDSARLDEQPRGVTSHSTMEGIVEQDDEVAANDDDIQSEDPGHNRVRELNVLADN